MRNLIAGRLYARGKKDLIFFGIVLALGFGGLLILYPASSIVSQINEGDSDFYLKRQAVWFLLGLLALFILSAIPPDILKRAALPVLIGTFLTLLLVFIPGVGHSVSSSSESFRRWISVGGFTFQPSEFAKIAIVVYLASALEKTGDMEERFNTRRLLFPFLLISTVLFAIALEPQYGTAICLLSVIIVMIYIAGFPILRLFLIFASSVPFLFLFAIYRQYRLNRLMVWLDPYAHRYEGGYQLVTSFRAFRDGGFFGEDLAYGFAHRYLTYGHTDFILALHAENFGWFGSMALIVLFGAFLWRGVYGIKRIRDPFLFLLASGSVVMIVLQTVLNMGVVTGLFPTTGVSLPFISYGGSSLVSTFAFCGLILNAMANGKGDEKKNG